MQPGPCPYGNLFEQLGGNPACVLDKAAKGNLSYRTRWIIQRRRHGETTAAPDPIGAKESIGAEYLARLGAYLHLAVGLPHMFDARRPLRLYAYRQIGR
jgi:hypothetical protein